MSPSPFQQMPATNFFQQMPATNFNMPNFGGMGSGGTQPINYGTSFDNFGSNALMPANSMNLQFGMPQNGMSLFGMPQNGIPLGGVPPVDAAGGGSIFDDGRFLGKGGAGWSTLNAVGQLGQLYLGMKQYGLAKDHFAEGKRQFSLNHEAQKKLTNSQLEDRQRARVAANPGAYESPSAYMKQYGV
jgi:hypothetical protein